MTPAQRLAGNVYTAAGTPVFSRQLAARRVEVVTQNKATLSSAKMWSVAMGVLGVACFAAGAVMMAYGFKAVPLDMSLVIGGGVTTLGGVVAIIFIARVIHNSLATESKNVKALREEESKEVSVKDMIAQMEAYAEESTESTVEGINQTLSARPLAFPEVVVRANEYFGSDEGVPTGEAQGRIIAAMALQITELNKGGITEQISSGLAIALLAHLDPEQSNLARALMKRLDHEQTSAELKKRLALSEREESGGTSPLQITFRALSRHPKVYADLVNDRNTPFGAYLLNVYNRMEVLDQVDFLSALNDEGYLLSLITSLLKEESLTAPEIGALAQHPQVIARVIFNANGDRQAVLNHFIPVMMVMTTEKNKEFFNALTSSTYGGEVLPFVLEHLLFSAAEEQFAKVAEGIAHQSEVVASVILGRLNRDVDLYKGTNGNAKAANARLARIMFSLSDTAKERVYSALKADVGFGKRLLNVMLSAVLTAWDDAYTKTKDVTFCADPLFKLLAADPDRFARLVDEVKLKSRFVVTMVDEVPGRATQNKIRQDVRVSSVLTRATLEASELSPPHG